MEIKAVFFDIDQTLVNDRSDGLEVNWKAIPPWNKEFCWFGNRARTFFVRPFIERYDFDFAVTYNGQYILPRTKVYLLLQLIKESAWLDLTTQKTIALDP